MTRFERAAALHTIITGEDVEISLRAYQLDPTASSIAQPTRDYYSAKFGGTEAADAVIAKVVAAGKITGIDFNFVEAVRGNSFDAHRLLTWADQCGPGFQRALAHELWRAYFLEGADISDHDTLAARAGIVGLDIEQADAILAGSDYADEVAVQVVTASEMGVGAVPMFIIDGRYAIQGTQSQDGFVEALAEVSAAIKDSPGPPEQSPE